MLKLCVSLLLSCLFAAPASAQEMPTVVAAFGDSLFSGYGIQMQDSFPSQLETTLKTAGYNVSVLNDGISGETTGDGLARINALLAQKPSMVVIDFGGNDLRKGVSPVESRKNLQAIMQRLHDAHISMVLLGLKAPITMGVDYASAFNSMYSDLASQYGVRLYPFILEGVYGHPELMLEDGIHPNKDGVAIMVSGVAPYVADLLHK